MTQEVTLNEFQIKSKIVYDSSKIQRSTGHCTYPVHILTMLHFLYTSYFNTIIKPSV